MSFETTLANLKNELDSVDKLTLENHVTLLRDFLEPYISKVYSNLIIDQIRYDFTDTKLDYIIKDINLIFNRDLGGEELYYRADFKIKDMDLSLILSSTLEILEIVVNDYYNLQIDNLNTEGVDFVCQKLILAKDDLVMFINGLINSISLILGLA
jgi:hypothetical protein